MPLFSEILHTTNIYDFLKTVRSSRFITQAKNVMDIQNFMQHVLFYYCIEKFVINKNLPIGLEAKSNLWGNCGVIVYILFVALPA